MGASARFKVGIAAVISPIARLANDHDHNISDYVKASREEKKINAKMKLAIKG